MSNWRLQHDPSLLDYVALFSWFILDFRRGVWLGLFVATRATDTFNRVCDLGLQINPEDTFAAKGAVTSVRLWLNNSYLIFTTTYVILIGRKAGILMPENKHLPSKEGLKEAIKRFKELRERKPSDELVKIVKEATEENYPDKQKRFDRSDRPSK